MTVFPQGFASFWSQNCRGSILRDHACIICHVRTSITWWW